MRFIARGMRITLRRFNAERYSREIGVRESFINPHPDLGDIISSRISDVITLRMFPLMAKHMFRHRYHDNARGVEPS